MDPGLPAEDLVLTAALAARDVDEDAYWELIFEPVDRSDEETFTLAERLTLSKDSRGSKRRSRRTWTAWCRR